MLRMVFLLSFTALIQTAYGQNACGLTADAGPDITICLGASATINGVVSGGTNPAIEWTPPDGLSDPAIANPIASPQTTTTYTLRVTDESANLIVNGGFETGDIAPATSDYTQVADPVAIATNAPNFYGILDVPQIVQAFGCQPDIGQYTMVIHGSTSVNVNFWCQTINVTPNTDYKLSFKVFGIPYFFSPAPRIVLKMNGTQIGNVQAPNGLCQEATGNFTWNSGANTTVEVCLANSTVAGLGSMCSVDDITMVECCVAEDEVTVTVLEPIEEQQDHLICEGGSVEVGGQTFSDPGQYEVILQAESGCDSIITVNVEIAEIEAFIDADGVLNCILDQVVLDGSLSNGLFGIQSYAWSTANGVFIGATNGPTATVGAAGTYTLEVSMTNGIITCFDDISIVIPIDTVHPVFAIDPPPAIDCQDTTVTLTASGVNLPNNIQITWTSNGGTILSGGNTFMPVVQGTGVYTLSVVNLDNGCESLDSVAVQAGGDVPVIELVRISAITCRDTLAEVEVRVVQPPADYALMWTTANGNILGPVTDTLITVDRGGNYQLLITDTLTGCQNTFTAIVEELTDIPVITLAATDTLGCLQDSILLGATVLAGFDTLIFFWSSPNGLILSGVDTLQAWAAQPGTYSLVAEHPATGCRDSAAIVLIADGDFPTAVAGPDLVLDCGASTVFPVTTGTSEGPEFIYAWSTPNGQVSPTDVLTPAITAPGLYILVVVNTLNGCQASDTVQVFQNADVPGVIIDPAATLTCQVQQLTLFASVTAFGTTELLWTGPAGGILSGATTINPIVNQPGWYVLTVTDLQTQCVATDSVLVMQDIEPPVVQIAAPEELDCNNPSVTLDASGSGPSGRILFSWTAGPGANIVSGAGSPMPIVNAGGLYTLLLTDTINGCTATQSVTVVQSSDLPTVLIQPHASLTCIVQEITLTATLANVPAGAFIQWSSTDGNITGPLDGLTTTVDQPGTYTIAVVIPASGCEALDATEVILDDFVPPVLLEGQPLLTCVQPVASLTADPGAFAGPLDFTWQPTGAGASVNGPQLTVSQPGAWQLVWIHPANGCADSLTFTVMENTIPPIADAGADQELPCGVTETSLSGATSSGQGVLSFQWNALNGQVLSGAQMSMATVSGAGVYELIVTDALNGCSASATVTVSFSSAATYTFDVQPGGCGDQPGSLTLTSAEGGSEPHRMTVQGIAGDVGLGETVTLPPGSYQVQVRDADDCLFETQVLIATGGNLVLTAPALITVVDGTPALVVLGGNFSAADVVSVTWSPEQGVRPTADPLRWEIVTSTPQVYTVTVRTLDNCEATATIRVETTNIVRLYMPNAFSPFNVDGINDVLYPQTGGGITLIRSFQIYDRWGNHLFERRDFPPDDITWGWDGTYRGKIMNPGVYVWTLEIPIAGDEVRVYKGEVTLF
jgi:gliding motility-associated-like protein